MLNNRLALNLLIRLFLALYVAFYSFSLPSYQRALVILFTTLYLSLSILNYMSPGKLGRLGRFVDLTLIPSVVLSQSSGMAFVLLPLVVYYANRDLLLCFIFLWSSIAIHTYHTGSHGLLMLPVFFGVFLASVIPDINYTLRKERYYVKKLRSSYSSLSKDLARLEVNAVEKSNMDFLFEAIQEQTLEGYLTKIKEKFEVSKIAIVQKSGPPQKESLINREETSLYVPIAFHNGWGYVVFYFPNPFMLNDRVLLSTLEKSAKLINLYVEGFDEGSKKDAVKLAV